MTRCAMVIPFVNVVIFWPREYKKTDIAHESLYPLQPRRGPTQRGGQGGVGSAESIDLLFSVVKRDLVSAPSAFSVRLVQLWYDGNTCK